MIDTHQNSSKDENIWLMWVSFLMPLWCFGYLDFQLRDRTLSGFIKHVFIWFWRLTNAVWIWKYVMVSKWWQHMNFWVNYPFKNLEQKVSRSCPVRIFISPLKQKHLRDVCLESAVLEIMLVKIISIYLFIACLLLWPSKSEKQKFPVSQVFVFDRWEVWDVNALKLSDSAQQELLAIRMICVTFPPPWRWCWLPWQRECENY